jgi:hypothetical protein
LGASSRVALAKKNDPDHSISIAQNVCTEFHAFFLKTGRGLAPLAGEVGSPNN